MIEMCRAGVLWLLCSLSMILCASELRLYTEDYRPFSYLEEGKPDGMAVAVVEELIRRTGEFARIELVPWTRGYHQVRQQADTALFATVRTPSREALFQWVGPIARGQTRFYSLKDSAVSISSLEELRQIGVLAVPKQWYSYELLAEQGLDNLYGVPTPQDMLRMFRHGRVKLLLANTLTLDGMLAEQGMRVEQLQEQFDLMPSDSYIAFSPQTDPERVARWQQALQQMRQDGSLERLYRYWFPAADEQTIVDLLNVD